MNAREMSRLPYALVHFAEDDTFEVIPTKWIKDDGAYYPNNKVGLEKAVTERRSPEKSWPIYNFELIKYYDDHRKATKKLAKVLKGSGFSTTEDEALGRGKRKRKRPSHYDTGCSNPEMPEVPPFSPDVEIADQPDSKMTRTEKSTPCAKTTKQSNVSDSDGKSPQSSDSDDIPKDFDIPCETTPTRKSSVADTPRRKANRPDSPHPSTSQASPTREPTTNSSLTSASPCQSGSNKVGSLSEKGMSFLNVVNKSSDQNAKIIVQLLNEILLQQKQNTQLLQALLRRDPVGDDVGDGEVRQASLPLNIYEDLQVLEENMERKDFRKALTHELALMGGIDQKDVIRRIMGHLFTKSLAVQFNLRGRGSKKSFCSLKIWKSVKDAAAKQGVAEALVERLVGNWLKYAPDRQGGRRARDKKKETAAALVELARTITSSSNDESD